MRSSFLPIALLVLLLSSFAHKSNAQISYDRIIQINGVIMTSDSLYGVPDVTVSVKNQNKGTYSSDRGVFALVCFKGDTLQFRAMGFTAKDYIVPQNLDGNTISMVQLMAQDTFYLNETIVHALPSKENFTYAFMNLNLDDDSYEIARKNSNRDIMRLLALTMTKDGREGSQSVKRYNAYRAAYEGQNQPMNILSPIKWGQFIEAWKRGDFRKKK